MDAPVDALPTVHPLNNKHCLALGQNSKDLQVNDFVWVHCLAQSLLDVIDETVKPAVVMETVPGVEI